MMGLENRLRIRDPDSLALEHGLNIYAKMVGNWVSLYLLKRPSPAQKQEMSSLEQKIDALDLDMTRAYEMIRHGVAMMPGEPGDPAYDTHESELYDSAVVAIGRSQIAKGVNPELITAMQVIVGQMADFARIPVRESDALMYMTIEVMSVVDSHAGWQISTRERAAAVDYAGCCVENKKIILPKSYATIVINHHAVKMISSMEHHDPGHGL